MRFDMSKKIQVIGNVTPPGFLDKDWRGTPFYWSVLLVQRGGRLGGEEAEGARVGGLPLRRGVRPAGACAEGACEAATRPGLNP